MYVHALQDFTIKKNPAKYNTELLTDSSLGERRNRICQSLKWKAYSTGVVWR